jgi:hypothetical protein
VERILTGDADGRRGNHQQSTSEDSFRYGYYRGNLLRQLFTEFTDTSIAKKDEFVKP